MIMNRKANVSKLPSLGQFLRLSDVKAMTGLSKTTIYARIAEGRCPRQIAIGPRLVVWIDTEIENWMQEQIQRARG